MTLAITLQQVAWKHPSAPALYVGKDCFLTYGEWAGDAARLAHNLMQIYGCQRGDRICIAMANQPAYLTILYACWHAGLCAVPVNAKLHAEEIRYVLESSAARLLLADEKIAAACNSIKDTIPHILDIVDVNGQGFKNLCRGREALLQSVEPQDTAWIFFTSGTTGKPKGAMLSHRNLMAMSLSYYADYGNVSPADRILHVAPLSHGSGLYALPFTAKGAAHVLPPSQRFTPDEVIDLINHHDHTTAFLAPTMIIRLMGAADISRLQRDNIRQIIYGGAPMHLADIHQALELFGPRLAQLYGQGESPMTISFLACEDHMRRHSPAPENVLQSVGWPRTGTEVRITKANGDWAEPLEVGEVVVRGDTVMSGYWHDPDATAATLKNGWLYTGDLGYRDCTGMLTLAGRCKEVIISGGSNIYPREIEDALIAHEGVRAAAVLGLPDPEWGEVVAAFIETQTGCILTPADLLTTLEHRIARFKHPKEFIFLSELPKNHNG